MKLRFGLQGIFALLSKKVGFLVSKRMHFGKIVKGVAYSKGCSAEDVAEMLGWSMRDVLRLYEEAEWTSGNIKSASIALEHNFGKYLDGSLPFSIMDDLSSSTSSEYLLQVKYPRGKEQLLKFWLKKMALVAKAIGLEIKG